jgi:hypothetical protein
MNSRSTSISHKLQDTNGQEFKRRGSLKKQEKKGRRKNKADGHTHTSVHGTGINVLGIHHTNSMQE